jgi:hypothetical protein
MTNAEGKKGVFLFGSITNEVRKNRREQVATTGNVKLRFFCADARELLRNLILHGSISGNRIERTLEKWTKVIRGKGKIQWNQRDLRWEF